MRYSVWNQAARAFDYYDTPDADQRANVEAPTHLRARTLGLTVPQACWPLPAGAQPAGSGPVPQGRIAIHPSSALGADDGGDKLSVTKGILLAIAGALGAKYLLPKRGRR